MLRKFWNRITKADQVQDSHRGFYYKGGILVDESTAMKVSAFYRGVIYVSTSLAKLTINIKDKDNNKLENDPVYKLWNNAINSEQPAFRAKLFMIQVALIGGNAYAEIERNILGQPVALWPLEPGRVEPWRDSSGKLWYRVTGGMNTSETYQYLEPKKIFHLPGLHLTSNGLMGESLTQWASRTLGISLGADRMASGLFNNGGLPSGILRHKTTLSDDAYKRIKDSWKEQYSQENAGGVAILEEGTEWQAINLDPQVLQFLESRKFGVIEIARFLGISPIKLYELTNANYNNAENANLDVANDTFSAWAKNLECESDFKLLNNNYGGKYTDVDLLELTRGDMKTRGTYYKDMMQVGAISPNEIRQDEGRPAYPGGDDKYIAVNNYTPANRVHEVIDSQISKGGDDRGNEVPNDKDSDSEEIELTNALIRKISRS